MSNKSVFSFRRRVYADNVFRRSTTHCFAPYSNPSISPVRRAHSSKPDTQTLLDPHSMRVVPKFYLPRPRKSSKMPAEREQQGMCRCCGVAVSWDEKAREWKRIAGPCLCRWRHWSVLLTYLAVACVRQRRRPTARPADWSRRSAAAPGSMNTLATFFFYRAMLCMRATSHGPVCLSECFLSGRGQGHVSNFYIVDLENFATASRR